MNSDDVRRLLQERIRAEGKSVNGFALEHGVSQSYLWNVLAGKNKPGPTITLLVGLKPVLTYEPIK